MSVALVACSFFLTHIRCVCVCACVCAYAYDVTICCILDAMGLSEPSLNSAEERSTSLYTKGCRLMPDKNYFKRQLHW